MRELAICGPQSGSDSLESEMRLSSTLGMSNLRSRIVSDVAQHEFLKHDEILLRPYI